MHSTVPAGSEVPDLMQNGRPEYVKKVTLVLKGSKLDKEATSALGGTAGSVSVEAVVPEGEEVSVSVMVVPTHTSRTNMPAATVPQATSNEAIVETSKIEAIVADLQLASPATSSEKPAGIYQSILDTTLSSVKDTLDQSASAAKVSRAGLQHEKARAMFEKHGLTLAPRAWPPKDAISERIEKPIRLRVHRCCHRCQSDFGAEKICPNCTHKRCTKCPRYSAKAHLDPKGRQEAGGAPADINVNEPEGENPEVGKVEVEKPGAVTGEAMSQSRKLVLTKPAKNGGSDLVHKPVSQRVRRTCHKCETEFFRAEKICAYCGHLRCKICPRDPPKLDKYPDGYPGDADPEPESEIEQYLPPKRVFRKARRRIRWNCHACSTLFYEFSKVCSSCQHRRCQECPRDPPKKIKPIPSFELLRSIEEKLANMGVP